VRRGNVSEAGEFLNERRTLDEIHREGGARFGWAWIDANRTAIEAARAAAAKLISVAEVPA